MRVLFFHHGRVVGGAPISLAWTINGLKDVYPEIDITVWVISKKIERFFLDKCDVDVRVVEDPLVESGKIIMGHTPLLKVKSIYHLLKFARDANKWVKHFKSLLMVENFDLVHLNSACLFIPALSCRALKIPVVWHIREYISGNMINPRRRLVSAFIKKVASQVITISDMEKKQIFGRKSDKVSVVYNFVDVEKFKVQTNKQQLINKHQLNPEKPIVLTLGGFSPRKGLLQILEASNYIECNLVVAGAIPNTFNNEVRLKTKLLHRAENLLVKLRLRPFRFYKYHERVKTAYNDLENAENIFFVGHLDNVADMINAADILVFSGTVPHFPRPVYEAWLMKTPVVVSNLKGMNTEVEHDINGFIVKKMTGRHFADEINRVLKLNESTLDNVKEKGYIKAMNKFTAKNNVKDIGSIYEKVLQRSVHGKR